MLLDLSVFTPFDLLPWQWAIWICMGLFIGLTKTGFSGATLLIIPAVAMVFGAKQSTGINLPILILGDILAVIYYRRNAEWKHILRLLPWTVTGFAVAILVEKLIPVQSFKFLMGGCILTGLIVMVWNDFSRKEKQPPSSMWFSAFFGIAAGFATLIGNVSAGIMAVFLLSMRLPKISYVGTTAWYFLIANFLKLPIQVFLWKNITMETFFFSMTNIPAVVAGTVLGIFLIKKVSEKVFRRIIMVLVLFSTMLLFIDFSKF